MIDFNSVQLGNLRIMNSPKLVSRVPSKGTINIPALLQKYVKGKTNFKNTVFWVFFPLRGEGKIWWLQGRKVFVGRNIRNIVCHSCDNTRGQHTVCVLSFSVCLLYFSRCLPNDRETGGRNVRTNRTKPLGENFCLNQSSLNTLFYSEVFWSNCSFLPGPLYFFFILKSEFYYKSKVYSDHRNI